VDEENLFATISALSHMMRGSGKDDTRDAGHCPTLAGAIHGECSALPAQGSKK